MSIAGKHSYRFGYLKSEQWQTVRIEALARESGRCQICGEASISNDAHHIWYPDNVYETSSSQLIILCRPCHDFIHSMMPGCKDDDEETARSRWSKFLNAIKVWRAEKLEIFRDGSDLYVRSKKLREAYAQLKGRSAEYVQIIRKLDPSLRFDEDLPELRYLLNKKVVDTSNPQD